MAAPSTHWLLQGTGPSAARWPRPRHPDSTPWRLATTNSGKQLTPEPDLFGVFEINAGAKITKGIRPRGAKSLSGHPCQAVVSLAVSRLFGIAAANDVIVVDKKWGPPELRGLHEDHEWGQLPYGVPDYGQRRSWISSGVMMLWLVAELYRPEVIAVSGLDGYPTAMAANGQGSSHGYKCSRCGHRENWFNDYAKGLADLSSTDPRVAWDSDPAEAAIRREKMNAHMALGIRDITNHYRDIRFIWLERPNHWRPDWRVEIAANAGSVEGGQQILDGLYRGWSQVPVPNTDKT